MRITELYIFTLYFVLIICSGLFFVEGTLYSFNIGILLILGNMLPGYALASSLLRENEN
mgnify:CR=1 FL=1